MTWGRPLNYPFVLRPQNLVNKSETYKKNLDLNNQNELSLSVGKQKQTPLRIGRICSQSSSLELQIESFFLVKTESFIFNSERQQEKKFKQKITHWNRPCLAKVLIDKD